MSLCLLGSVLVYHDRSERLVAAATSGIIRGDGDHRHRILALREDVGRHNAMDKAIGSRLLAGRFPALGVFAWVSGRASSELVQKGSLAGLAGIVAVGPPSSLAVDLARERGKLLCGFVRGESFDVYAGSHRLRCD